MMVGISLMLFYMTKFKFDWFGGSNSVDWWWGISPKGFGSVAMVANFAVALITPPTLTATQQLVKEIRKL